MQMKDRTNTIEDYIIRAGIMRTLAQYYKAHHKNDFADRCNIIEALCLEKLAKSRVRYTMDVYGKVKFDDAYYHGLYVGIRPSREVRQNE